MLKYKLCPICGKSYISNKLFVSLLDGKIVFCCHNCISEQNKVTETSMPCPKCGETSLYKINIITSDDSTIMQIKCSPCGEVVYEIERTVN